MVYLLSDTETPECNVLVFAVR